MSKRIVLISFIIIKKRCSEKNREENEKRNTKGILPERKKYLMIYPSQPGEKDRYKRNWMVCK